MDQLGYIMYIPDIEKNIVIQYKPNIQYIKQKDERILHQQSMCSHDHCVLTFIFISQIQYRNHYHENFCILKKWFTYDETTARICNVQKKFPPIEIVKSIKQQNWIVAALQYCFLIQKHDNKLIPRTFLNFKIIIRSCLMPIYLIEPCCKGWYHLYKSPYIPKGQNDINYQSISL
ncbi:unnamed protein product [Paramecium primaurelia]|uniref:Uncharacterized protein n=1 Tax=Paramecium primaurelia TaxID=5886 RepID=A0A8S1PJ24_PARPR|nr:unnamed protein product [Paramecium primaurelia]